MSEEKVFPIDFEVEDIEKMDEDRLHVFSAQCWKQYDALIEVESGLGPVGLSRSNISKVREKVKKLNKLVEAAHAKAKYLMNKRREERKQQEEKQQQPQQKRAKK